MWSSPTFYLLCLQSIFVIVTAQTCSDNDPSCPSWVSSDPRSCLKKDYIKTNCRRSCRNCPRYQAKYDLRRLPPQLRSITGLVGKWRGEHTGRVSFPTIPTFKYSEEIDISIPEGGRVNSLNYTAVAWSSDNEELHSEYGYITVKPNTREILLTTVMGNGFITVEEGPFFGNTIKFVLKDIGRISFVRDEHLHNLVREWTIVDSSKLKARLSIQTLSHKMSEHTSILYSKVPL
ncbi:unnamed protein product [Caenorhabditis bovis]|uniref:ShKT domain-containing protein n=1 Tax=Caenorhabditis bovis TaxID=2654633 RepID=A0A8S1E7Q3_9PELO|nr:unnamed protein product [Caenorhabditis bovis]